MQYNLINVTSSDRPLQRVIYVTLLVVLTLTILVQRSDVSEITGLAWDSGAVTTGCVTVPLVLALGIGILTSVRTKAVSAVLEVARLLCCVFFLILMPQTTEVVSC